MKTINEILKDYTTGETGLEETKDRKSTRLNSSH